MNRVVAATSPDDDPVTDAVIRRLIEGVDTEDIVVHDVSDRQLYGRRRRRRLSGDLADAAVAAGCVPEVYQSVYWMTLAYQPFRPLGTYVVMPRETCDDPDGDAEQYRAVRIPVDRRQVRFHYTAGFVLTVALIAIFVAVVVHIARDRAIPVREPNSRATRPTGATALRSPLVPSIHGTARTVAVTWCVRRCRLVQAARRAAEVARATPSASAIASTTVACSCSVTSG